MKIIFSTALYPPETADSALYVKELAERLSKTHEIIVVAYASTSEKIKKAKLITTNKRKPLIYRLIKYTINLFAASKNADIIYMQNSIAVGLPTLIVGFLRRIPIIINFDEDEAQKRAKRNHNANDLKIKLIAQTQKFILQRARAITVTSAYLHEILVKTYHIQKEKIFTNYNPAKKEIILPFPTVKVPNQVIPYDENKTRAEMWYLYKTSQICILNQAKENVEDIQAECFSAGIPVVMKDETNFEEKVAQLLKDANLRETVIKNNQKILAEKFSWENHSRVLVDLFGSFIPAPSP